MENKLSRGETSPVHTDFEQFMEVIEGYAVSVPNLCGEKSVRRKDDKYEVCQMAAITNDHFGIFAESLFFLDIH